MPYIKPSPKRDFLKKLIETLGKILEVKGDLTYCYYKLAKEYLKHKGENYQNISDVCAAMSDAEFEVRRRILAPYEDKKIEENGDVE